MSQLQMIEDEQRISKTEHAGGQRRDVAFDAFEQRRVSQVCDGESDSGCSSRTEDVVLVSTGVS